MTRTDAPALPDVEISKALAFDIARTFELLYAHVPVKMGIARKEVLDTEDGLLRAAIEASGDVVTFSGQLALDMLAMLEFGLHIVPDTHPDLRDALHYEHTALLFRIRATTEERP